MEIADRPSDELERDGVEVPSGSGCGDQFVVKIGANAPCMPKGWKGTRQPAFRGNLAIIDAPDCSVLTRDVRMSMKRTIA